MVQKVNQNMADSNMMNAQPRFLPRSMTNNAVGSSTADTKSFGGSSTQTGILPPTNKYTDNLQTQNLASLNMNRSNHGSQDMQNP